MLCRCIEVELYEPRIDCNLFIPQLDVELENICIYAVEAEHYQGSYYVVPTAEGFVLETADKIMDEDLNVLPIPYYEVDNPQGGLTVSIAS